MKKKIATVLSVLLIACVLSGCGEIGTAFPDSGARGNIRDELPYLE